MRILDLQKGIESSGQIRVEHVRRNQGYLTSVVSRKIGIVKSAVLTRGKTSATPDMVEVEFNRNGVPYFEQIRYNKLRILDEEPALAATA